MKQSPGWALRRRPRTAFPAGGDRSHDDAGRSPRRPIVVVLIASYPAVQRRTGPAQSVHAVLSKLAHEFTFLVVTSCEGVRSRREAVRVIAPDKTWTTERSITRAIRRAGGDVLYVNSLFNWRFGFTPVVALRLLKPSMPILLAPRGELAAGALAIKRWRKRLFILAFSAARLHRFVCWQASTDLERADLERVFGPNLRIHVASDLREFTEQRESRSDIRVDRTSSGAKLVFMSRITPKKNLHRLIASLGHLDSPVSLTIAGPVADGRYWDQCKAAIAMLPHDKQVTYVGAIPADEVLKFLETFELFVLPTLGENFGHAILEALAAGVPVVIGRDTPWSHVEDIGAGWRCDPTSTEAIAGAIAAFTSLSEADRAKMRTAAHLLASEWLDDDGIVDQNRRMLSSVCSTSTRD